MAFLARITNRGRRNKAYYRQGVALQCMGRHSEALAAFAVALAQDQKSTQLLQAITEAAINSPYKQSLEPLLLQLKRMDLDTDPFVIIAIIGQELLAVGEVTSSICVLESALTIGTENQKLHGSILSALSSAYWKMGETQKASDFMQQDLEHVKLINDEEGICRAHGNLGNACYSLGQYKEAMEHHRSQLAIAMKLKNKTFAAAALTSLGHVYVSMGDYSNALASHKRCALVQQQLNDKLAEARELGNVGSVYTIMGDFENAIQCHLEYLKISEDLGERAEMNRAYSNLGSLYHNMRDFDAAIEHYRQALKISEELKDTSTQCRSIAGLGHAYRAKGDYDEAIKCHSKQLKLALDVGDRAMEGRARSNMGVTLQEKGQYAEALEFHKDHLQLCGELDDKEGEGRACGNIGNAYHSLGQYERAIKYQKLGLALAKELRDKQSEATMHGNLAVAFQALGDEEDALQHYQSHLEMAKILKDLNGECLAESNLGNFFSAKGDYLTAVVHFENQLAVATKLNNQVQLCKSTHSLAFAYYSVGKYDDAIDFYEKNIGYAEQCGDKSGILTAYCNLGFAYFAIKDYQSAFSCQERYLELVKNEEKTANRNSLMRAFVNLGETCLCLHKYAKALSYFQDLINLFKNSKPDVALANGYAGAGRAYQGLGKLSEALSQFLQEVQIRRNLKDAQTLVESLDNLGSVFLATGDVVNSKKVFYEQLQIVETLNNPKELSKALSKISSCLFKSGCYDECIKSLSRLLDLLKKGYESNEEFARAFGMLGECYVLETKYSEALPQFHNQLKYAAGNNRAVHEHSAYSGLGNCQTQLGNYSDALVYFEKCLVLAQDIGVTKLPIIYSKLGLVHSLLHNYEQSIMYYEKELQEAQAQCNLPFVSRAYGELGGVYSQMEDFKSAQSRFEEQLHLAESLHDFATQGAACNGIGNALINQKRYKQAIKQFEKSLEATTKMENKENKFDALTGLGKAYHLSKKEPKANEMFQKATEIANLTKNNELITAAYFRLGVSFYVQARYALAIESFENCSCSKEESKKAVPFREKKAFLYCVSAKKMIQRSLVMMKQEFKSLIIAENKCSCVRKEKGEDAVSIISRSVDKELEQLKNRLCDVVIYFSITIGYLFIWLLMPGGYLRKFIRIPLIDGFADEDLSSLDVDYIATGSSVILSNLVEKYIAEVRENLGVEEHATLQSKSRRESMGGDLADLVIENANATGKNSRIGLPAKVQHPFLSSTPKAVFNFSLRPRTKSSAEKSRGRWDSTLKEAQPFKILYRLLIGPLGKELEEIALQSDQRVELCIVAPQELMLIPFSLLLEESGSLFLRDKFHIRVSTTLKYFLLREQARYVVHAEHDYCLVGTRSRSSCTETNLVGDLLECKPLFGDNSTKEELLKHFESAKIFHFATDVLWSSESIMLGDLEVERSPSGSPTSDPDIESLESEGRVSSPPLPSTTISTTDLRQLGKVNPQLVVFGLSRSCWGDSVSADSFSSLIDTLLSIGVDTVVTSLWSVDAAAMKIFLSAFYKAYLNGETCSRAFDYGIISVRRDPTFAHPSFWGGFTMYGRKSLLEKKKGSLTHVLQLLLEKPNRDAIKVLLHLVEKSRQRIAQCRRSAMYTAESSIRGKVGDVLGWRDLLLLVGFKFERAENGLPDSVFFPSADHSDVLNRCSNTLYAFLGLSRNGLEALSKLRSSHEAALPLINLLHEVIEGFANDQSYSQVALNIKMWRIPGCHEFLSSLGFDLMGVGREDVLLRSGKSSLRRPLQCALQAVMDLFEIENSSVDFMSNLSGKAYSETHLGDSPTRNALNVYRHPSGERNGYHPMRKVRSTPIRPENGRQIVFTNNSEIKRKKSNSSLNGSNGSQYLGAKVGLFGGMDSPLNDSKSDKEDTGASVRRLRARGTTSRISLDNTGSEVLLCKGDKYNGKSASTNLQRYTGIETLESLSELPGTLLQGHDKCKKNVNEFDYHDNDSVKANSDFEVEKYLTRRVSDFTPFSGKHTKKPKDLPKSAFRQASLDETNSADANLGTPVSVMKPSRTPPTKKGRKPSSGFWSRFKDIDGVLEGKDTPTHSPDLVELHELKPTQNSLPRHAENSKVIDNKEIVSDTSVKGIPYFYRDELRFSDRSSESDLSQPRGKKRTTVEHSPCTSAATMADVTLTVSKTNSKTVVDKHGEKHLRKEDPSRMQAGGKTVVKVGYSYVPTVRSLVTPPKSSHSPQQSTADHQNIHSLGSEQNKLPLSAELNSSSLPHPKKQSKKLLELRAEELLQSGDIHASLC